MGIIDFTDTSVTYPGGLTALKGVTLSIEKGEFVVIVGPSGCGKSTLLRILGGLLRPEKGEVVFQGRPLSAPRPEIGFVFQRSNLMPWRAVLQNVLLPLEIQGVPRREAEARASEWIRLVGLTGFERNYPRQLSGGMQQRVMIAMALACDPVLLIADEPTSALDVTTQVRILALLSELQRVSRMAMLFITHDLGIVARMADRVCVMESGRIVERGATQKMLEGPQHACTQRLLQAAARFAPRASLQVN